MRAALVAIALVGSVTVASASPARCLIEVDGKAYLFGQCNAEKKFDGGLSVGTGETRASPFFAIVNLDDDGGGMGFWNEEPKASHAQSPLGRMRQSGGCWLNDRAKVCAWPTR